MKNSSLIIQISLALAIIVLYILHFTGNTGAVEKDTKSTDNTEVSGEKITAPATAADPSLPIAYVNIDTLLNNMQMYDDITRELSEKQRKEEMNLQSKLRNLQREYISFQDSMSRNLYYPEERERRGLEIQAKDQRLQQENNQILAELQQQQLVSQNRVIDYIMEYLKEYNSEGTYRYIFSFSFGGGLLYANESMDITSEVLKGINQKYAAEKASQ